MFYSSKKHGTGIDLKSIIKYADPYNKKTIHASYEALVENYGAVEEPTPVVCVPKVVNDMRADLNDTEKAQIETHAIGIITNYCNAMNERHCYMSYAPKVMASIAVYYAANDLGYKVTQKEVSAVYRITDVTLRNRTKEMVQRLGLQPLENSGRGKKSHRLKNS
jgi:transcription initiation factor TFIIIB Brf1 subunit/transcription initiation factor TFIIB